MRVDLGIALRTKDGRMDGFNDEVVAVESRRDEAAGAWNACRSMVGRRREAIAGSGRVQWRKWWRGDLVKKVMLVMRVG
jgi:hypothetical protein